MSAGNASLLIRTSLLMKFIAAVLHSRASMRKWSRTSKVNAVDGRLKLAGKSFECRSWMYGCAVLAHLHHITQHFKIPVDDTMIRLDFIGIRSPDPWYSNISSLSSLSSDKSRLTSAYTSSMCGLPGVHSCVWYRTSITSPSSLRSAHSKYCLLNLLIWWKGELEWAETQQMLHRRCGPKQSIHWYVPRVELHTVQVRSDSGDSCHMSSMSNWFLFWRYSRRNLFCD